MLERRIAAGFSPNTALPLQFMPQDELPLLHLSPRRVASVLRRSVISDEDVKTLRKGGLKISLHAVDQLTTALQVQFEYPGHDSIFYDHPLSFVHLEHLHIDWRRAFSVPNGFTLALVDDDGMTRAARTVGLSQEFVETIHHEALRQFPLIFAYTDDELDRIHREHAIRMLGEPIQGGIEFCVAEVPLITLGMKR